MEALKAIETVEKATEWKTNEKLSPSVKGLLTQVKFKVMIDEKSKFLSFKNN